jgi:ureidoglycolate lyase
MRLQPEQVTIANFRPYGTVVCIPEDREPTASSDVIDYWSGLACLPAGEPIEVGIATVWSRTEGFREMERHLQTPELLVPLDNGMVIPIAPAGDVPDPANLRAFVIRPDTAVLLDPGVWHWVPYPLGNSTSFLVIFRRDTGKNDLEVKPLAGGVCAEVLVDTAFGNPCSPMGTLG